MLLHRKAHNLHDERFLPELVHVVPLVRWCRPPVCPHTDSGPPHMCPQCPLQLERKLGVRGNTKCCSHCIKQKIASDYWRARLGLTCLDYWRSRLTTQLGPDRTTENIFTPVPTFFLFYFKAVSSPQAGGKLFPVNVKFSDDMTKQSSFQYHIR